MISWFADGSSLTYFYENILKKAGAGGTSGPCPCPASLSPRLHPYPRPTPLPALTATTTMSWYLDSSSRLRRRCAAAGPCCGGSRSCPLRSCCATDASPGAACRQRRRQAHDFLIETCLSLHYCDKMHWSLIQRLWPGSIAAANPAGSRLTRDRKNQYIPVHTSMYSFTDSCTAMYLHVPPYTVPCTVIYHLVPPCTTLNHDSSTGQYIPEHPATYGPRNFLCQYILVLTKMRFLVPPCRQNRTYRDVPVQTALYRHLPGVQDSRCHRTPTWTCCSGSLSPLS